ncbi:MAG: relaxase/mobilization nuclease domain-containing protein, partial [Betaproteobacteria bacterium]
MILKEIIGQGLRCADEYASREGTAHLIATNMAGRTPRERAVEFRFLRSARPRLARACAHLILSHAPTDRPLTQAEWAQAVELALSKKGASGVAFVAFQHPPDADHDHDHVHVIYCRVKPDGAVVSDSNSYKANTRAARS